MQEQYKHGWFKVAFEHEIEDPITPVNVGKTRLILVRTGTGLQAYSADCPHRGAHLAYGGRLDGCDVVCPFHGYRIGLAKRNGHLFSVPAYETLVVNGLVFVRLSDQLDNGFTEFITALADTHHFIPAFHMPVQTAAAMVTENGFDNRHFPAVHGIQNDPTFTVGEGPGGEVMVESVFEVPGAPGPVPYEAHTFSPGLIVVHLSGDPPYSVITGTTPTADGNAVINLSLALDRRVYGDTPDEHFVEFLIKHSRRGLEEDKVMWENMVPVDPEQLTPQDHAVRQFQAFCRQFAADGVAA